MGYVSVSFCSPDTKSPFPRINSRRKCFCVSGAYCMPAHVSDKDDLIFIANKCFEPHPADRILQRLKSSCNQPGRYEVGWGLEPDLPHTRAQALSPGPCDLTSWPPSHRPPDGAASSSPLWLWVCLRRRGCLRKGCARIS